MKRLLVCITIFLRHAFLDFLLESFKTSLDFCQKYAQFSSFMQYIDFPQIERDARFIMFEYILLCSLTGRSAANDNNEFQWKIGRPWICPIYSFHTTSHHVHIHIAAYIFDNQKRLSNVSKFLSSLFAIHTHFFVGSKKWMLRVASIISIS